MKNQNEILNHVYLQLVILGKKNISFAIATDSLKATLRNHISQVSGITGQVVQEYYEGVAQDRIKEETELPY